MLVFIIFLLACNRWKELSKADKIIGSLIGLTLLQEVCAYACNQLFKNNMFTYHFYSPVEFFLLCLYFNQNSKLLRRYNLGLKIGIGGVIVSLINTLFLQPLTAFNSYYLLFEGTVVIILCLAGLCEILLDEVLEFYRLPYFWFTLALLFYWSLTYTSWGVINLLDVKSRMFFKAVEFTLYISNLLFYISIGVVFLNYKKLHPSAK